jgi:hypothetical protein
MPAVSPPTAPSFPILCSLFGPWLTTRS